MGLTFNVLDGYNDEIIDIGTLTFYGIEGDLIFRAQIVDEISGVPYYISVGATVKFTFPGVDENIILYGAVLGNRSLVQTTIPGDTLPFVTTGGVQIQITEGIGTSIAYAGGAVRKLSYTEGPGQQPAGTGVGGETVKTSGSDPAAGYLLDELLAGAGIQITKEVIGGQEKTKIAAVSTPVEQSNLTLKTSATFTWDLDTNQLLFDDDIEIHIPGTSVVNTIDHSVSSPILFLANDQVAYIDVSLTASQTITVTVVDEASFVDQQGRYIMAKRLDDEVTVYDLLV